jgi:hypothetical protein
MRLEAEQGFDLLGGHPSQYPVFASN